MAESISVAGSAAAGPSDLLNQNTDAGAPAEHPNESVLREIRKRMGNQADLLRYLPIDSVCIEHLGEDIRPASAIPYQMRFGTIWEPSNTAGRIRILLRIGPLKGPPEIRYHVLAHHGDMKQTISAARACQEAEVESAFRCIREDSVIDDVKVRALVKYYFLATKSNLRTMWLVNDVFIKELVSACQIAKRSLSNSADTQPLEDSVATQTPASCVQRVPVPDMFMQVRPQVSGKSLSYQDHPRDTYEGRWLSSISSEERRKSRYSGPYICGQPLDDDEPFQDTLMGIDKDNVHGRRIDNQLTSSSAGSNETRCHALPHPKATQRIRSALSLARDGANEMGRGASVSRLSPASVAPRPTHHQSRDEPVKIKDHVDFITSYGKTLEDEEQASLELNKNITGQKMTAELIKKCQEKLATLQTEEKRIKNKRQQGMDEKKRLRESLSETERAFLSYGIELGKKSNKRAKLCEDLVSDGNNVEE